jgi:hypothetical protein
MQYLDERRTDGPPRESPYVYEDSDPVTAADVAEYHAKHEQCGKCRHWFRLATERIADLRKSKRKFVCKGCGSPAAKAKAEAEAAFEALRQRIAQPGATLAEIKQYWTEKARRDRQKKGGA